MFKRFIYILLAAIVLASCSYPKNYRDYNYKGYYYVAPFRNEKLSVASGKKYLPTFNEAMKALIANIKVKSEFPHTG